MPLFIGPVLTRAPEAPKPPGIIADAWCYLVPTTDHAELEDFVTTSLASTGATVEHIRTPALGSSVTYIALSADQRGTAVAEGALEAPSEGKLRSKAFDGPSSTWEPGIIAQD